MSMTPDAGSYFQPLNYTTSFTNPAGYNNASLQNVFGQGQQGFDASIRDIEYTQKLFQHYYEKSLMGVASMPPAMPAGTFSEYNAGGSYPSGGGLGGYGGIPRGGASFPELGASPYQTTPNVWETGASPFIGGGGSSGFGGSIYQNMPSIDWGRVGQAAAGLQAPAPSQSSFDWTKLFGGGAQADPFPGMKMPGGLGSPMVTPQQQPKDYSSLFGRGVGGTGGAPQTPQPAAPSPNIGRAEAGFGSDINPSAGVSGQPAVSWDKLFGGIFGGSKAAEAPQQPQAGPQQRIDEAFKDLTPQRQQAAPAAGVTPQAVPEGSTAAPPLDFTRIFDQPAVRNYTGGTFDSTAARDSTAGGGLSAADLGEQARQKLSELMRKEEPAVEGEAGRGGMVGRAPPAEAFAEGERVPLPRARPEAADAPRPKVALGTTTADLGYLPGRSAQDLKGVNPRFTKALQEYAREYNAGQDQYDLVVRSGLRTGPKERLHRTGEAIDINLIDRRNGERLTDYQTRDPVVFKAYQDNANQFHQFLERNYPDLAAQHRWGGYFGGPAGKYGAQDIMHHDLGARIGMAGGSWQQGLNQQQADFYELPYGGGIRNPYPQFNFDWSNAPIPDVGPMPLTYKSPGGQGPNAVYQYDPATGQKIYVPLSRNAKGETSYGELPSRSFVPAAPAGASAQRFGGGFGGSEFSGQAPSPGAFTPYENFRPGANFENRTEAPLPGRDELVAMQARGLPGYELPEAEYTPLGADLGLLPRMQPAGFMDKLGPSTPAAEPQGSPYWKIPDEGTPQWNQEVYEGRKGLGGISPRGPETVGGASAYENFPRSENVIDRRTEQLGRDELARLKAIGTGIMVPMPDTAPVTPLGAEAGLAGLRNTPLGHGLGRGGWAQPPGAADGEVEADNFDDRFNAIDAADLPLSAPGPGRQISPEMQQNLDELGKVAAEHQLPGEAGRGGMVGRPAPTRDDLVKVMGKPPVSMTFGGGFSPSPEPRKGGVGPEVTLSPEHMQTMMQIESGGREKEKTGSYKGVLQLDEGEFRKYGGTGDIYDFEQNYGAAGRKMTAEGQMIQDRLGRALTPVEQYMVHQQGPYGTLAHLANPDQLAWKSWQSASHSSDARAKEAIMGNLTPAQKATFGDDVNKLTSRDFVRLWDQLYADKAVEAGLPRPGPGGYFNSTP